MAREMRLLKCCFVLFISASISVRTVMEIEAACGDFLYRCYIDSYLNGVSFFMKKYEHKDANIYAELIAKENEKTFKFSIEDKDKSFLKKIKNIDIVDYSDTDLTQEKMDGPRLNVYYGLLEEWPNDNFEYSDAAVFSNVFDSSDGDASFEIRTYRSYDSTANYRYFYTISRNDAQEVIDVCLDLIPELKERYDLAVEEMEALYENKKTLYF